MYLCVSLCVCNILRDKIKERRYLTKKYESIERQFVFGEIGRLCVGEGKRVNSQVKNLSEGGRSQGPMVILYSNDDYMPGQTAVYKGSAQSIHQTYIWKQYSNNYVEG